MPHSSSTAAGRLFGVQLGTFFSVAMVACAGAAILYDTSNVIHHYSGESVSEIHTGKAVRVWICEILRRIEVATRRSTLLPR